MLFDAHTHLQDPRLDPWRATILDGLSRQGIAGLVVNGTRAADWPAVAALALADARVQPSFGLHPWCLEERGPDWLAELEDWLRKFPQAGVGEFGLDRWMRDPDLPAQRECFLAQMDLAVRLERPATIHCLRAWGLLQELLRAAPRPGRGFLLHSYGGPVELVPVFARLGAYFSVSPWFGHPAKADRLAVFRQVPLERLLIETDAPDMAPPMELDGEPLPGGLNRPGNLRLSLELLARVRPESADVLEAQLADNHRRFFGGSGEMA
jgi:TatD DNase family protein